MVCGIVGVTTDEGFSREPLGKLIKDSLKKLEYRGYDSVGLAVITNEGLLEVRKSKGMIDYVSRKLGFDTVSGITGIGHTRWATHGKPSDENAHPHTDCSGRIAMVHNGIIENYKKLKEFLIAEGHSFASDTDTEVIPHLVESFKKRGYDTYEAFKRTVELLEGAYALAMIDLDEPKKIFFARRMSPLIIGLGTKSNFVASDVVAFLNYTRKIIVLMDGEVGYVTPNKVVIEKVLLDEGMIKWVPVDVESRIRIVEWSPEMASKEGYDFFMLKEIHEQPYSLASTLSGVVDAVNEASRVLARAERVLLLGAGTSYHASLIAALLLRRYADLWAEAIVASESRWWLHTLNRGDIVIGVSQSGETIDTLKGIREAKERGALTIAVTNVVESTMTREADMSIYIRAGPEIGVAATKTFTSQVALLSYLAIKTGELRTVLKPPITNEVYNALRETPNIVAKILREEERRASVLADKMRTKNNVYYLGRGLGLPVAMEGALKMKEIAYVHAEAYPAGESKHGPIALIEEDFPVVFVILSKEEEELIKNNIEEMKARGAYAILVSPSNAEEALSLADFRFVMPVKHEVASTVSYVVPLQLLAYYTAIKKGLDPDKPRNLAKTVTVF
ncbi:MAG: glutamine--fructose-6-phosphate transaminase (isomerizing) [Desulfurococcaceae archaeon TW002]